MSYRCHLSHIIIQTQSYWQTELHCAGEVISTFNTLHLYRLLNCWRPWPIHYKHGRPLLRTKMGFSAAILANADWSGWNSSGSVVDIFNIDFFVTLLVKAFRNSVNSALGVFHVMRYINVYDTVLTYLLTLISLKVMDKNTGIRFLESVQEAKKRTSAQNIPGRPDESQHYMGRGWTHCDGRFSLASSCCPNVPTGTGGTKSK